MQHIETELKPKLRVETELNRVKTEKKQTFDSSSDRVPDLPEFKRETISEEENTVLRIERWKEQGGFKSGHLPVYAFLIDANDLLFSEDADEAGCCALVCLMILWAFTLQIRSS